MTKMINCSSLFKISVIWMQVLQHSFDTFVKKLSYIERKEADNINFVGLVNYKETTMFCVTVNSSISRSFCFTLGKVFT